MTSSATRMPRLLVLASTYPRWQGDPEPGFVHELSRRLARRFEVIVLCPHARGAATRETMDGVRVLRYRYAPASFETLVNDGGILTNLRLRPWTWLLVPGFILGMAWRCWRLLVIWKPDVVHAHWLLPQGLVAAMVVAVPGVRRVPFVVTAHGADLHGLRSRWMGSLKRFVATRAASITVVSRAMAVELGRLGVDYDSIDVEPMGVDLEGVFEPDPAVRRSDNMLLFVGRLVEKKGLRHLVAAMPQILEQHPDVTLCVAGFGPEEPTLRAQVRALELDARVTFLGAVPQSALPALYRQAAVFVAPFVEASSGDQEGLGLVLVEAIGCGCPIVAGNVPALRDLLKADDPGLVDPHDEIALAASVIDVLLRPGEARKAAERRRRDVAMYDWSHRAAAYDATLHAAVEKP